MITRKIPTLENAHLFTKHPTFTSKGEMESYLDELREARRSYLAELDDSRKIGFFPVGFQAAQDVKSGSGNQTGIKLIVWSYSMKKLYPISANMHKQDLKTALSREWCLLYYPEYRTQKGEFPIYEPVRDDFSANAVINDMQEFCEKRGELNSRKVFNAGVYRMPEAGRGLGLGELVINTGSDVFNERGEPLPRMLGDSIFQRDPEWTGSSPFAGNAPPFSERDSDAVLSLVGSFGFSDVCDARMAYGWLLNSIYSGAAPRHPHIFLTGPRGGGKTTLMKIFNALSSDFDEKKTLIDAKTSPAGLLQNFLGRPFSVFIDEFEQNPSSMKASENTATLLDIMTASYDGGVIMRGTPEGGVRSYECRSSFMCAAINPPAPKAGLATRSMALAFRHSDRARDESRRSKITLNKLIENGGVGTDESRGVLREIGRRLRRHMLSLYPVFIKNHDHAKGILSGLGYESRFGDTFSPIIAAEITCRLARTLTPAEMRAELDKFGYEKFVDKMISDESNALSQLLSADVTGLVGGATIADTIGGALEKWVAGDKRKKDEVNEVLGFYHARLLQNDDGVWLAASYSLESGGKTDYDASFAKLLARTTWEHTYRNTFSNLLTNEQRQDQGFVKRRVRFGGVPYYCILIRMPVDVGTPEEPISTPAIVDRSVHIPHVSLFDKFHDRVAKYLSDLERAKSLSITMDQLHELDQMFSF